MDGFEATLDHVLRLTTQIRSLEDKRAESMRVLESLARSADQEAVKLAALRLADAAVPGRAAVRQLASAPPLLQPGDRFRRRRGAMERWPDISRIPAFVYLLMQGPEVVYVGFSTKIRDRLSGHAKKSWDAVEIIACRTVGEGYRLEGDLIYQHQPVLNQQSRRARRSTTTTRYEAFR